MERSPAGRRYSISVNLFNQGDLNIHNLHQLRPSRGCRSCHCYHSMDSIRGLYRHIETGRRYSQRLEELGFCPWAIVYPNELLRLFLRADEFVQRRQLHDPPLILLEILEPHRDPWIVYATFEAYLEAILLYWLEPVAHERPMPNFPYGLQPACRTNNDFAGTELTIIPADISQTWLA